MAFARHLTRAISKAYTTEIGRGEPRYSPKYPDHPPCGVRCFTDGQTPGSVSGWLNDAIALPTLALYTSWLHILLALLIASFFWRPAAITLAALVATTLLPAKPLRWQALLQSRLFESWRRYFHFSFLFEEDIDESKDYLFAQFPHGAFPLGPLLGATSMACEFPAYKTYLMAANSVFSVPFWRHFNAWLGAGPATRKHFKMILATKAAPRAPAAAAAAAAGAGSNAGAGQQSSHPIITPATMTAAVPPVALAAPYTNNRTQADDTAEQSPTCSDAAGDSPHAIAYCRRRPNAKAADWQQHHEQLQGHAHGSAASERASDSDGSDGQSDSEGMEADRLLQNGSPLRGQDWGQVAQQSWQQSMDQEKQQQEQLQQAQQQQRLDHSMSSPAPAAAAAVGAAAEEPCSSSRQGTGVALVVGGIAEMFLQAEDHEAIYLHKRKGFVALALEAGIDIVPVYSFGNSSLLSYRAPRWLAHVSRKMRASVGLVYGRWGLVIPRKLPVMFVLGRIVRVGEPMARDHPQFEQRVREVHGQVVGEVVRLYHAHREQFGWADRPLVVL